MAYAAVRPLRSTFESLGLKEDDVARLHEQFVIIDKDGSGAIELWELLDYLDLQRNRFAKRVFAIFDADGSGEGSFAKRVDMARVSTEGNAYLDAEFPELSTIVRATVIETWRERKYAYTAPGAAQRQDL